MGESSVSAAAPGPSDTDFWLAEVPGGAVSIRLSLDVVDRLGRDVVQAFRAVTSRGSEVGGILLGRVAAGPQPAVIIDDYEAVACDYRRGPLYRLAEADRRRLEASLERRRGAAGRDLSVVGFCRSNTRKDLALDDDDLTIIREYFSAPDNVFLLIKPMAGKANLAGFFFWEDGKIEGQASRLTFPFNRAELVKAPAPAVRAAEAPPPRPEVAAPPPRPAFPEPAQAAAAPPPVHVALSEPVEAAPPPARPASPEPVQAAPPPVRPAVAEPLLAAPPSPLPVPILDEFPEVPCPEDSVAAQSAAPEAATEPEPYEQLASPSSRHEPAAPSRVSRVFARLAPLARKRWFRIGTVAAALAAGGLLWMPKRGTGPGTNPVDSSLALKVERDGGQLVLSWNRNAPGLRTAQEAVLSISDGARQEDVKMDLVQLRAGSIVYAPASSDVSFRMNVKGPGNNQALSESVRFSGGQPAPAAPPSGRPQPMPPHEAAASAPEAVESTPPREPPREMVLPTGPSGDVPPEQLDPGEALPAAAGLPVVDLPPASTRPVPSPPPPPPPPPKPVPAENQVAPLATPAVKAPAPAVAVPAKPAALQTIRVGGAVQEAKLMRGRTPVYPPLARQARLQGIVRLEALIGTDGRVVRVEALSGPPLLRQAALDAVKQWVYQPSLLNGQPVQVSTQIDVNFTLGQ